MAISERLKEFLDASKVTYRVTRHPTAYTAQELAAAQHVPGRQLAKCVLINTDRGPLLAVLPAVALIDLKRLKALVKAKRLTIAKEAEIAQRFPDVEVGAMSPFGTLYQIPVVMERALEESEQIVFNGDSHSDTVTMRSRDVVALVKPNLGLFGQPIRSPAKANATRRSPARARGRTSASKGGARARTKASARSRAKAKGRR